MKTINKDAIKGAASLGKQRSYNEITEYLDAHWTSNTADTTLTCMKQLDKAFGNVSQKINTILVTGTNGKSLTINFAVKLFLDENLNVGAFYAPHILTYNERFSLNNETISNKTFTELGNEVINMVETLGIQPNSYEMLTMMSLLYFHANKVDVALLELNERGYGYAPAICTPKVAAITRITSDNTELTNDTINAMLSIVKPGTNVVSADQSKLYLQSMLAIVKEKNGIWGMPIRKLAPLGYPFEQLHGRCAALAERIASVYINNVINKEDAIVVGSSLLTKQKGQRGRPTLEAKRQSEMHPKKTLEQFWKDTSHSLSNRFQLLEKEKPTLLLDTASNLDAFKNLLLGIRLLHYQRPLKGLTLIIGSNAPDLDVTELLKLLRYFFKKTSGSIIVCPVDALPGQPGAKAWDTEKVINSTKIMKIKAKASKNFKEAFEMAQKSVDDRHGLVVITGSNAIVSEYWRYKDVKKL